MILCLKVLKNILQSKRFYLIIIIFIALYIFININIIEHKSIYNLNNNTFYGTIIKINKTNYGYSFIIDNKEKLICYTTNLNYNIGDYVRLEGNLEKPLNNTVINNFNYKEYLEHNKIFYILKVKNISLIKKNKNIINKLIIILTDYLDKYKSSKYLKLLILHDTNSVDNNIYNSFQINGITHLLSIGSIYISFFSYYILKILKKLKINEYISYIILFLILFLFLIISNYNIVFLRVLINLILKFLNKKFKFHLNNTKIFLLNLFFILFINPFYIYHKGFLYSYGISFIIILNKNNIKGSYLIRIFKISIISFIYSIPFNIYFNYSINILSIIYNIIFIPIFNIIIFPIAILVLFIPFLDNIFYIIFNLIINLSIYLNKITFGIIIFKKINIFILIVYLVIFTYIIKCLFNYKKKNIFILIIILLIHYNINYIIKNNFYMVIDVSQGDSSLIYYDNNSILIDTGGVINKNISENTINMLKSLGIRKIDTLIITHGDFDHMGEAINLVNNFKVEKVIFNCGPYNDLENELIKVLDKNKIKHYSCIKELNINKNKLYFLQTKVYDNENDNSNVIYTELNGYKFMFMGDASIITEKEIMNKYNLSDIDVLKVGHHGSKTSSSIEFINEINPKYSLISVGKNNRYGHPNKEVLDSLEKSKIYRTDENGSIMFKIKNNKLKIETCSP